MDLIKAFAPTVFVLFLSCEANRLQSGQIVCKHGTQKPCYKIVYFHDVSRRVSFVEAQDSCQRDGGHLMTIESEKEQKLIEVLIQSLTAADGDFWLGLRRKEDDSQNASDCQSLYRWVDGTKPTFWNWYVDEPSCGSEVCVVMYHQPSAPPGVGGPYKFQWNDDRCNMLNNFICKYPLENPTVPPPENKSHVDATTPTQNHSHPEEPENKANETMSAAEGNITHFILIAAIPLTTLLLIFSGLFCCIIAGRRDQVLTDTVVKEPEFWMSPNHKDSPDLEIYHVIKRQTEADLASTRPDIQNTSFRIASGENSPPDNLSGDYDNMRTAHSESGFVTLASTESGFVTNELYELCSNRVGKSESGWVENEIYGY
ncbi:layilin [Bombina bombina]|uniref:layilin n=1 Tax=Bombina bombina TaxID=8345 RepID=UPI00235B0C3B|nr:layilin [Bombina bombina]